MRSGDPRYPVDRYLVESSKKFEMVSIIEDIWNPEPALRPEDEMILRKLHEMLQSTADDLKLLSGELSKYHQPGVQYKTPPTPLDEEFNEKIHIEEVVNAKFHGYKIIEKTPRVPDIKPNVTDSFKFVNIKPKVKSSGVQVNSGPVSKKLSLSRTRFIEINEENDDKNFNKKKLNNGKIINEMAKVAYNEFSYKYIEPTTKTHHKPLNIQQMPSINIRNELKEQKVLQLDIIPENKDNKNTFEKDRNVLVVSVQHETLPPLLTVKNKDSTTTQVLESKSTPQPAIRKISKMTASESSSGSNNVSSDVQITPTTRKKTISACLYSPKTSVRKKPGKTVVTKTKKDESKRQRFNLDEWKKKLSDVYGPSTSHNNKTNIKNKSIEKNVASKKLVSTSVHTPEELNNAVYIPYSQLTLGGVRVSDIEREISDIDGKNEVPLSPTLNKILGSRETSFVKDNPRKQTAKDHKKILTTSDENLLQEVIDIEKTVSETLSKNVQFKTEEPVVENVSSLSDNERHSYNDDFEEDKSDGSANQSLEENPTINKLLEIVNEKRAQNTLDTHNTTYTKSPSLAIKESVDIFEFIHAIDTQDTAVQSTSSKIIPKETQTSPRYEKENIQPIHNDLWPSIDPKGEVEKILTLEKDFIKKLIIEEYADVLEKSLNKPSTSNLEETSKNMAAFQKNTQTSPARVKNVMTSPARTKTRSTSPLKIPSTDHQTSPMIVINDTKPRVEDDLTISVNLSSPRFSLRLPQNSRDVLSNLESSRDSSKCNLNSKTQKNLRKTSSSTSSIDADNSSSELSSLGEVRFKLRKFTRKIPSIYEFSDSSSNYNSDYQTTSILPLRSEGEISLGQTYRRMIRKNVQSEGETSNVAAD